MVILDNSNANLVAHTYSQHTYEYAVTIDVMKH